MSQELVESSKTTTCRKCFAKIPATAKSCPECGASKKSEAVPAILVILLLASSFLLMSSSYVTTKQIADEKERPTAPGVASFKSEPVAPPAPKDLSQSAYQAAKKLVKERFPEAMRISEPNESPVGKNGDIFQVTLFVDLVENGSPSRTVLQVKLAQDRGNWQLKEIVK